MAFEIPLQRYINESSLSYVIPTLISANLEAISPLLEREAPGLVHLLLSTSMQHTPMASLSRPVAGTIGSTLVVTLPGSPKAVKENITALISNGVINHAIELIKGGSTHASMSAKSSIRSSSGTQRKHHHQHGHDHSIPTPRTASSHDPDASGSYLNSSLAPQ